MRTRGYWVSGRFTSPRAADSLAQPIARSKTRSRVGPIVSTWRIGTIRSAQRS